MKIEDLEIDKDIYPRKQMSQKRIESYQESLRAKATFPPILVQKIVDDEGEKVIVLDGVHRITAYENEKYKEIEVTHWKPEILDKREPEILEQLRIVATQENLGHGVPLTEGDIGFQCQRIAEDRPIEKLTGIQKYLAQKFGVTEGYMSQMVGTLVNRRKASRDSIILRLSMLGWTQQEIADILGLSQQNIAVITKNFNIKEISNSFQQGKTIEEIASYYSFDQTLTWAIVLQDKSDLERFELFGNTMYGNDQPKIPDYWKFDKRDPRIGSEFDGALWGQDVMNILYRFSKQGDLIVDPMAGGGTVIDTCLIMNRECRAYDIKPVRKDITEWDIREGFSEKAKGCSLIIFDPPYYKKKENEYGCEEITKDRQTFIDFVDAFAESSIGTVKKGGYVSLVYGQYLDYEDEEKSILGSDLVRIFEDRGFRCILRIQSPLDFNTQWKSYDIERAKRHNPWQFLSVSRDWHIFKR